MSIAEKLVTIAENQQRVFDAGRNDVINQLKENQKGSASGEVIKITDVSSIDHNLDVKLSSGNTELKVYGKNLFNNNTSLLKQVTFTVGETASTRIGYEPLELPCGTYTFTLTDLDTSITPKYIYGQIVDKDNNRLRVCNLLQSTTNYTPLTITVGEGERVLIYNSYADLKVADRAKEFGAVQIQLEVGNTSSPYEPYKLPTTYTSKADGTVEGVKRVYPSMTLVPSEKGVSGECEYIKDLNAVVDEITNAIITLGGIIDV